MASVLCKRVVSLKLRGSTYNGGLKGALCYGPECWDLKKTDGRKLLTTEMRMPGVICGKTLKR